MMNKLAIIVLLSSIITDYAPTWVKEKIVAGKVINVRPTERDNFLILQAKYSQLLAETIENKGVKITLKSVMVKSRENVVIRFLPSNCQACLQTQLLNVVDFAKAHARINVVVLTELTNEEMYWANIKYGKWFKIYYKAASKGKFSELDLRYPSYSISFGKNYHFKEIKPFEIDRS